MNFPSSISSHQRRSTALSLVTAFLIVFLGVQLWLLVQVIEGASTDYTVALPATLASGLCFLGAWGLWRAA
jgi:hypothetical protein